MAEWQPLSTLYPTPLRSPRIVPPPPPTERGVRVGPIIRDIVIVWLLTGMGGIVVGVATGGPHRDPERFMLAGAASNILLGSLAFVIVGYLAPPQRWRHLGFVALGAWLTSFINVLFVGLSVPQWIFGAIPMAIIMGLGGGISYAFKEAEGDKRKAGAAYIPIRAARVARMRFAMVAVFALVSLIILITVGIGGVMVVHDWLDSRPLAALETNLRSTPLTPPRLNKGDVVPILDGIQPWQLDWDHDAHTPLQPYWNQIDSALADQHNASALFNMAVRCARGDGVPCDPAKALAYCRQSADLNYEPAKNALKKAGL